MKKYYFFLPLYLFLLIGCNNKPTHDDLIKIPKGANIDSSFSWENICNLDENLEVHSKISSFDFVDESLFVVSIPDPTSTVILYDTVGEQLREIGNKGRGPFEYLNPSIVRVKDQNIYVWCNKLLKLIKFDSSGKPVEEYTKFERAIKDFVICNNYVGFYSSGGFDESILKIYDLNKKKFIQSYGGKTTEHKILNTFQNTGGITCSNGNIFFAPIDKLSIYKINLDDMSSDTFKIDDPDFNVKNVDKKDSQFIYSRKKSFQYFFTSDFIDKLFCINKRVIVKAQVGSIKMNDLEIDKNASANNKSYVNIELQDSSAKKQKYYVFDENMNLKYAVRAGIKNIFEYSGRLYASQSQRKYLYFLNLDNHDSPYKLKRIDLLTTFTDILK